MNVFKIIFGFSLVLTLAACGRMGIWTANLRSEFVKPVAQDMAYGSQSFQRLDVYAPKEKSAAPRDVIVFFYGGRWERGQKSDYRFVADAFVKRGYIVVLPDYRKYPHVKFPDFVEDGAMAVRWVHDHIADYGGNPGRIHLAGHSAGAHIAALLTANENYLKGVRPRSFAGLAGPYDFTPDDLDLIDMFGPPANYPQMQVRTFIDGHEPPMLLLQGDRDTTVNPSNREKLEKRITEKRGWVRSIVYPGIDHVWIVGSLSWLGRNRAPVADDMDRFFHGAP